MSSISTLRMPYVERGGNKKTTTNDNVTSSDSSTSPIVFLSGFPDNELSSWGEHVPASLEADGHRMVFMCLPGYETVSLGKGKPSMKRSWGYSLEEVLQIMHSTILDLGKCVMLLLLLCYTLLLNVMIDKIPPLIQHTHQCMDCQ